MHKPKLCDNCGRQIEEEEIAYWVRLEIFASPEPPEIKLEDLDHDYTEEIQALIEKMEDLGPEECEAQVYEAYRFIICSTCRKSFHDRLKHRKSELS